MCICICMCISIQINSSTEIGRKLFEDILGELMAGPYAGQDRGLAAILAAAACNIAIGFNLSNDFP